MPGSFSPRLSNAESRFPALSLLKDAIPSAAPTPTMPCRQYPQLMPTSCPLRRHVLVCATESELNLEVQSLVEGGELISSRLKQDGRNNKQSASNGYERVQCRRWRGA